MTFAPHGQYRMRDAERLRSEHLAAGRPLCVARRAARAGERDVPAGRRRSARQRRRAFVVPRCATIAMAATAARSATAASMAMTLSEGRRHATKCG